MFIVQKSIEKIGHDFTGYILVFCSTCSWYTGLLIAEEAYQISFAQIGIYIGIANICFSFLIAKYYKSPTCFSNKKDFRILILRHILFALQNTGLTLSLKYIPAPIAYTITDSGPVFMFIIDHFKNKTPVRRRQIYGIIIAVLGIVVVINSQLIYYWLGYSVDFHSQFHYIQSSIFMKNLIMVGYFIIIIFFAYAVILIKDLKNTDVTQINLHIGYTLVIWNTPLLFIYPNPETISFGHNIKLLFLIGIPLAMSFIFYNSGLRVAKKTGVASMMDFSVVIIGYVVSIFKYNETVNLLGVVGSLCIFVGLLLVVVK